MSPIASPGSTRPQARQPAAELSPFDPAARGEWAWEQPRRFRSAWTLGVGGAAVATLDKRGRFGASAVAQCSAGTWLFHARFPGDVAVVAEGAPAPCARYHAGWFEGGRIQRADGTTLLWRREDFWRMHWGLLTPDKLPLVHLRPRHGFLRRQATVELEDAARHLADLPMLVALGWFLAQRVHHSHGAH